MSINLANYYDRFNPDLYYDRHLFRAGSPLQSAELNEIQLASQHRLQRVTETLFREGDVMSGAVISVSGGVCSIGGGAVYLAGAVRGIPERSFNIPMTGAVSVGVYLVERVVTDLEDPNLRDPAVSSMNSQEPGAARLQIEPSWGYEGDGRAGAFYPVYRVEDGLVLDRTNPPEVEAISAAISRYDRQSTGGMYVSNGMLVQRLENAGSMQVYSISAGVARVFGREVKYQHSKRVEHAAIPDQRQVEYEPHVAAGGTERIETNRSPLVSVESVAIVQQVTDSVTRGVVSGGADLLAQRPVSEVVSVTQGGTTYTQGADYQLQDDQIDWSPGGDEPAPGSSYSVVYRYVGEVSPAGQDATGFTITGAVAGSTIQVSYHWSMPRFDVICINVDGDPVIVTGVPAVQKPREPSVPSHLLKLATIEQRWFGDARVMNNSARLVSMGELNTTNQRVDTLFALVSENRLLQDASQREAASKRGVFADPFINDTLRDLGVTQTAGVFRGQCTLGVNVVAHTQSLEAPVTLDVNESVGESRFVVEQPLRTATMLVNPYDSFSPLPAVAVITPAVDFWTETDTASTSTQTSQLSEDVWTNPEDRDFWINWWQTSTHLSPSMSFEEWVAGHTTVVDESVLWETEQQWVGSETVDLQFLREIEIGFELSGFGPGESLRTVRFDGVEVDFLEVV